MAPPPGRKVWNVNVQAIICVGPGKAICQVKLNDGNNKKVYLRMGQKLQT